MKLRGCDCLFAAISITCSLSVLADVAAAPDGELVPASNETLSRSITYQNDLPGGGVHTVLVYKAVAGATAPKAALNLYMHKPVWALVPGHDGAIVSSKTTLPTGGERWRLVTMLTSPTVRGYLRGQLLTEPNVTTAANFDPAQVDVKPFSVLTGDLKCYASLYEDQVLAIGHLTNDLSGDNRVISLDVSDPKALSDAISKKSARCDIAYSYLARQVSTAQSATTFTSNVSSIVEQYTAAERAERGGISFAGDYQRIKQRLTTEINVVITANGASAAGMLPNITDSLMTQLFASASFTFSDPGTAYQSAVLSYLKADAQKVVDSQTETQKHDADSATGVNFGIDVKFFKFTAKDNEDFKSSHELTTKKDTTTETTLPGAIQIYTLRDNWRNALVTSVSTVILSHVSNGDRSTDQLDMALLQADAEASLGAGAISPAATGLLPGMSFCYFGAGALPNGWTALDGSPSNVWPTYAWVPLNLRGQPMPDMRNATPVGAMDDSEVGTSNLNTAFKFPPWTVLTADDAFVLNPARSTYLIAVRGSDPDGALKNIMQFGADYGGIVPGTPGQGATVQLDNSKYLQGDIQFAYPPNFYAVHTWRKGSTVRDLGPVDLSKAPQVPWGNGNRPPYAKCRWVVKS